MSRMIDADALIKIINVLSSPAFIMNGFRECADKRTVEEIVKMIEHMPTIEPEQRWIPCSERLPEDEQIVLVTYKTTDRLHVCQYYEDGSRNQWYSLNDMCRAHNNVVAAWMPLPEPYKEGAQL